MLGRVEDFDDQGEGYLELWAIKTYQLSKPLLRRKYYNSWIDMADDKKEVFAARAGKLCVPYKLWVPISDLWIFDIQLVDDRRSAAVFLPTAVKHMLEECMAANGLRAVLRV